MQRCTGQLPMKKAKIPSSPKRDAEINYFLLCFCMWPFPHRLFSFLDLSVALIPISHLLEVPYHLYAADAKILLKMLILMGKKLEEKMTPKQNLTGSIHTKEKWNRNTDLRVLKHWTYRIQQHPYTWGRHAAELAALSDPMGKKTKSKILQRNNRQPAQWVAPLDGNDSLIL